MYSETNNQIKTKCKLLFYVLNIYICNTHLNGIRKNKLDLCLLEGNLKALERINLDCYINSSDIFILTFIKLTASLLFFVCHHSCLPISLKKLNQVFGQINTFKKNLSSFMFIDGTNYIFLLKPTILTYFLLPADCFCQYPYNNRDDEVCENKCLSYFIAFNFME